MGNLVVVYFDCVLYRIIFKNEPMHYTLVLELTQFKKGSCQKEDHWQNPKNAKENFKKIYCPKSFIRSYRSFIYL